MRYELEGSPGAVVPAGGWRVDHKGLAFGRMQGDGGAVVVAGRGLKLRVQGVRHHHVPEHGRLRAAASEADGKNQ